MKELMIIDVNDASRHAGAVQLALQSDNCDLLGITVAWGGVPFPTALEQTCELAGNLVPVYGGCPGPMARHIYQKKVRLPEPVQMPANVHREHAVAYLVEACRSAGRPVTMVALGPLTNIAMALRIAPDIAKKIHQILVVDATDKLGYATENLRRDPEAAQILLRSSVPVTIICLRDDVSPACAVAGALDEHVFKQIEQVHVQVSLDRGLGAGALLHSKQLPPNARLVTQVDAVYCRADAQ